MSKVSYTLLSRFTNRDFVRRNVIAAAGFVLGLKACDLVFFSEEGYDLMREELEDEFWAKHGKLRRRIIANCCCNSLK